MRWRVVDPKSQISNLKSQISNLNSITASSRFARRTALPSRPSTDWTARESRPTTRWTARESRPTIARVAHRHCRERNAVAGGGFEISNLKSQISNLKSQISNLNSITASSRFARRTALLSRPSTGWTARESRPTTRWTARESRPTIGVARFAHRHCRKCNAVAGGGSEISNLKSQISDLKSEFDNGQFAIRP